MTVVGSAHRAQKDAVAPCVDAAVGGHGVAVGVILAVVVVELLETAVACGGGIGDADLGAAVVVAHGLRLDVGVERLAFCGDGECVECLAVAVNLHAEFDRVAVLACREAVGCGVRERAVGAAGVYGIVLDALLLKLGAVALESDVLADVAGAEYDHAVGLGEGGVVLHADCAVLGGRDGRGCHAESGRRGDGYAVDRHEVGYVDADVPDSAGAVEGDIFFGGSDDGSDGSVCA